MPTHLAMLQASFVLPHRKLRFRTQLQRCKSRNFTNAASEFSPLSTIDVDRVKWCSSDFLSCFPVNSLTLPAMHSSRHLWSAEVARSLCCAVCSAIHHGVDYSNGPHHLDSDDDVFCILYSDVELFCILSVFCRMMKDGPRTPDDWRVWCTARRRLRTCRRNVSSCVISGRGQRSTPQGGGTSGPGASPVSCTLIHDGARVQRYRSLLGAIYALEWSTGVVFIKVFRHSFQQHTHTRHSFQSCCKSFDNPFETVSDRSASV